MTSFTIAHISDLHFSNGTAKDSQEGLSHSISHLQQIQNRFQGRDFDKVIVSGDLTDHGDIESFIRVKEWLHNDVLISATERTGLKLPPDKLGIIPGNHDAYNCKRSVGNKLKCWQNSIENFHKIFPNPSVINGCHYDWIEKDGESIYIVYVDSCFLGDPALESMPDIKDLCINQISKIARGNISLIQSKQLLQWMDYGMMGKLKYPGQDKLISKQSFAKAFKIFVMHHYLFEPTDYREDFFLSIKHRDAVFRNIAMADFDLCLCGHKHIAEFKPYYYGNYFDRRQKGKYLVNLFRRVIGTHSLPFQFEDKAGKPVKKWLVELVNLCWLRVVNEDTQKTNEENYIEKVMDMLTACIRNPANFGQDLENFIKNYDSSGYEILDKDSLVEIQNRVIHELSKADRAILGQTAEVYLKRIVKGLYSRPFVQSMAGSSAKACGSKDKTRSFNIYTIDMAERNHRLHVKRYTMIGEDGQVVEESENEHTFYDLHRLTATISA